MMVKKKILILETSVFNGRPSGGSFLQAKYYRKLLQIKGYQSDLVVGNNSKNFFKRVCEVITQIKNADLIIGFGTPLLCFYLQWICFFINRRGVFCIDSIITPSHNIYDHVKHRIFNHKIIFSSLRSIFYDNLIVNLLPPKLNLINIASSSYVCLKLKKSFFKIDDRNLLYPRINWKKKTSNIKSKNVLYYGALYRGRGLRELIQGCRLLWQKDYDFKLLILGYPVDPLTKETVVREIKRNETKKVILYGRVSKPYEYVAKSAAVILPFRYPCSFQPPYTLLEPMAIGVPVITTDVGSHGEWIKDKETGLFCEIENPQDIADKIEMIFKDKVLRTKIVHGARNLLDQRYKKEDLLLKLLKDLKT